MADDEGQAPDPLPPEEATEDSEAVKMDDDRYVGVDLIYKQSAYEEPLETEPVGRSKAAKEEVAGELDMLKRVKANEAGCVVKVDEPVPFEEWVAGSASHVAKLRAPGANSDAMKADAEETEAAKGEDGRIPPNSTSLHQSGVNRV